MKKTLIALLCIIVTVMLTVPASAVAWTDNTIENVFDTIPAEYAGATVVALYDSWVDGATNARGGQSGEGNGFNYLYLKADGLGDFNVKFSVDKDGVYDFAFKLMGWTKSVLRSTDISIDGGEKIYIGYDYAEENQHHDHFFYGISAPLTAGEHTLTLSLSADFDDSNVKSLYFDSFYYVYSANQPAAETEAPAEAPAEAPVEAPVAAPQTADMAAAAIAVFAAAAVVVLTKKK